MRTLSAFAAYVALPYILGYILFVRNLESVQELLTPLFGTVLHRSDDATTARRELDASTTINTNDTQIVSSWDVPACYATLGKKLASKPGSSRVASWFTTGEPKNEWESSFERLSVVMHRNGQADPCGSTGGGGGGGGGETPRSPTTTATITLAAAFRSVLSELPECPNLDEKYAVESLLTRLFAKLVPSCSSQETNDPVRSSSLGLLGFCDMGESKTPILLDHTRLVPIVDKDSLFLPCHFHNTNGIRLTALHQFTEWARSAGISSHAAAATAQFNQTKACNAAGADTATGGDTAVDAETCTAGVADEQLRELHLYAVPAGRVFMHSAAYVGQIIDLPHVRGADPTKPVFLQVLSVSPAVFDLYNFFTRDESKELVERALSETKETHRIKRSTTGNVGHAVNNRRTSESGYDTDGKTSMAVKRYVHIPYQWNELLCWLRQMTRLQRNTHVLDPLSSRCPLQSLL